MFGCTDLRISLSEAEFDAEVDFDIRSVVGPPQPYQIDSKKFSETRKNLIFCRIVFFDFLWVLFAFTVKKFPTVEKISTSAGDIKYDALEAQVDTSQSFKIK